MKKKIFLTSALAMGFVAPAFAEMLEDPNFPDASQGEYMQENTRYIGAATSTNMDGVYEDGATVDANALYDIIQYSVEAGLYFTGVDGTSNNAITAACTPGSYCPGVTSTTYENEAFGDTGIQSCPTDYALSAEGATSQNECYRTCSGNVTIEHATGVTGNDYYGTGVDTCVPTGCVNGWHLKTGMSGSEISSTIDSGRGVNSAYISRTGTFYETDAKFQPGNKGQAYYGLTDNNTWAVEYASNRGMLIGQGRCSTQPGRGYPYNNPTITSNVTDDAGQNGAKNCYCNVTGYKDASGTLQSLSSPWVCVGIHDDASDCADNCADYCAYGMRDTYGYQLDFRFAVLDSLSASPTMCEANTITINWTDVDEETAGQNNEGTATYGGDVRTPVKAKTYKGRTFKGWRFSAPEQTNLPE